MRIFRTIRSATKLVLVLVLVGSSAEVVPAQDASVTAKFSLFSVEGLVTGKTIAIDASYGEKHGVPIPAPFTFLVPDREGVTPLYNTPTQPNSMLVKVNFATEERQLIENLQFVTMSLPMADHKARFTNLARLLANNVYNSAVKTYPENKFLGARETKIGNYDAVEVIGKYVDPNLGLVYLRIVGIPNPDGAESIFTVANIVASRVEIKHVDDLARTLSGTALRYFEYRGE